MARAQEDGLALEWDNSPGVAAEAARFAFASIGGDTAYISHGEIQTGLSLDERRWSPELETLYAEDFAALDDARDLLVARDRDGAIVGIAVVAWEETPRRRFAVLEDMAVDPARRSLGIGGRLLAAVKGRVRDRGVEWLFLESGVRNAGAHGFFERAGFTMISHVFAMRLPLS